MDYCGCVFIYATDLEHRFSTIGMWIRLVLGINGPTREHSPCLYEIPLVLVFAKYCECETHGCGKILYCQLNTKDKRFFSSF